MSPILLSMTATHAVAQVDAIILNSGIQHIFDLKKPESIDMTSQCCMMTFQHEWILKALVPELDDEININYVAIVKLALLFLPHFLKLSVRVRSHSIRRVYLTMVTV